MTGFSKEYWEKNYETPKEMDGIANAKEHAQYIKSFFGVEYVDISSIIDFGFGLGFLFEEVLKEFIPYRAEGIEPSSFAFDEVKKRGINKVESTKLILKKQNLLKWCIENKDRKKSYDLGICTSVFQYLEEDEIKEILPILAEKVKYLYFSVPTKEELQRQIDDLDFKDEYAIARNQKFYLDRLSPYFTIVGARFLESRVHFDKSSTLLTDLLFRF